MKSHRLLAVVVGVVLVSASFGQSQDSSSRQRPADGDVVRITTNLVQVDAVITDKNGKPVTDLNRRSYSYPRTIARRRLHTSLT